MRSLTTLLAVATLSSFALACVDHDIELLRRNSPSVRRAKRAAATTEQESAAEPLSDECQAYYFEPVANMLNAGGLPPIWETANLSHATPEDNALFQALSPSIPNIAPRGNRAGDFTGVTYNMTEDPDCWWTDTTCTTPKLAGLHPDVTRCPEPNVWGLSFDDGPNCSHNAFYDYLRDNNQKATLFYIGSNVADWPLHAQRGIDDGHEVCAHTWSHPYMTALTNEEVFAELYYSKKAIKAVLGMTVQCWRPPYGDVDDRVRYIAQALGLTTIVWHDNTFDYSVSTLGVSAVQANYDTIFAQQANGTYNQEGTIVLTHELVNQTMQLAVDNHPTIRKDFRAAVPVAVCMNNTNPYVETGYTYPNFAQYTAGTTSVSLQTATADESVTISMPLSTGLTGSLFATLTYTNAPTALVASTTAMTTSTASGSSRTASGATTAMATGSKSASATATHKSAATSLYTIDAGKFASIFTVVSTMIVFGAFLV